MQAARRCHSSRRRTTGWPDPASAADGVAGSGVGSRRGGRIRRQHPFPRRIRVDSGHGTAAT
uniref:Uncharacterized protein n=1 Tax=Oryza meridionalis TaxID=40149 RepID=A0A0E0DDK4_9ORYZ